MQRWYSAFHRARSHPAELFARWRQKRVSEAAVGEGVVLGPGFESRSSTIISANLSSLLTSCSLNSCASFADHTKNSLRSLQAKNLLGVS